MALTFIQSVNAGSGTENYVHSTSVTGTFAAGNAIIFHVVQGGAANVVTVADTAGNTYTKVTSYVGNGNGTADLWYATNIVGGANTITATNAGAFVTFEIYAQEWSGAATIAPIEAFTNAAEVASVYVQAHTAGSVTTLSANAAVGAFFFGNNPSQWTVGAGYSNFYQANNLNYITTAIESVVKATIGTYTPTATTDAYDSISSITYSIKPGVVGTVVSKTQPAITRVTKALTVNQSGVLTVINNSIKTKAQAGIFRMSKNLSSSLGGKIYIRGNVTYPITLTDWYANGFKPALTTAQLQSAARHRYDNYKSIWVQDGMPTNMPAGAWRVATQGQVIGGQKAANDGIHYGTVSEGMGYAMICSAFYGNSNLPAGIYDPTAQTYFNGLLTYYKYYENNNGLMNWSVNYDGTIAGFNGATDGDLDVAMALIIAHRQWGSAGAVNYAQEATKLITAIRDNEFVPVTGHPNPNFMTNGDGWGFDTNRYMHDYLRVGWMREYYYHTGDSRWLDIIAANAPAFQYFYDNYTGGVVPDGTTRTWLSNGSDGYNAGYNAIRIGFGLSSDFLWHGAAATPLFKNFITRTGTKALAVYGNGASVTNPGYDLNTLSGAGGFGLIGGQMFGCGALMSASTQTFAAQIMTQFATYTGGTESINYFPNGLAAMGSMFMAGIAQPGVTDTVYTPPQTQIVTAYQSFFKSAMDVQSDFTTVTPNTCTISLPNANTGNPGNSYKITTTATASEAAGIIKELPYWREGAFDFKLPANAIFTGTNDFTIMHGWNPTYGTTQEVEIRIIPAGAGYSFEVVLPDSAYLTLKGTTQINLGSWVHVNLKITDTDISLYLNNNPVPEVTKAYALPQPSLGPVHFGKFYGATYIGDMYYDNIDLGAVTSHSVVITGPSASQTGKLSVYNPLGATTSQRGSVRVQRASSVSQGGVVRIADPAGTPSTGTRTNYAPNPSFEGTMGITSYGSGASTFSTDYAYSGTTSLKMTGNMDGGFQETIGYFNAGDVVTFSAYVKTLAGITNGASMTAQGPFSTATAVQTLSNADWTRKSITVTLTQSGSIQVYLSLGSFVGGSAGTCYWDALQVEKSATATPYFDGSFPGASWTSTPNNSISTISPSIIVGRMRVRLNGSNALAGVVKVNRAGSKVQAGIMRLNLPSGQAGKLQTGVVRVVTTQINAGTTGKIRVVFVPNQVISGKLRVALNGAKSTPGTVRVRNTGLGYAATGRMRIQISGQYTYKQMPGKLNVMASNRAFESAVVRISNTNSANLTGKMRLVGATNNFIGGKLRILAADFSIKQVVIVEYQPSDLITIEYADTIL